VPYGALSYEPVSKNPGHEVLHYVERWLPLSEQFVYGLVTNSTHSGVVVSSERVENREVFPYEPLVTLQPFRRWSPKRLRRYVVAANLMLFARRYSAGLVHVHHGYRAYEAIGTCLRLRLPLVVSLHGHDVTGYLEQHPSIYDVAVQYVDAVITPSHFLAEIAATAGFPRQRIHVIPSGVDTALFTPTPLPAARDVLFVGRFVEKKGLDTLLEAWPSVRRAIPGARLKVLGFGPLEHLARSAGESVEVVVRPDQRAVRDAMRDAYVVVSPSRTAADDAVESLLIVNLEAQASGRPVVTTRHGGIPEFVLEDETALVVPEADADALAQALIRVLTDDILASKLAANGPGWANRFDVARCTARVDELYEELLVIGRRETPSGGRAS
jgi:glycosyltransferase involved in cell wall biosynthesis